jgi:hypothetical protein
MSTEAGDQATATRSESNVMEGSPDGEMVTVRCRGCLRELARILSGKVFCRDCRMWSDSHQEEGR